MFCPFLGKITAATLTEVTRTKKSKLMLPSSISDNLFFLATTRLTTFQCRSCSIFTWWFHDSHQGQLHLPGPALHLGHQLSPFFIVTPSFSRSSWLMNLGGDQVHVRRCLPGPLRLFFFFCSLQVHQAPAFIA